MTSSNDSKYTKPARGRLLLFVLLVVAVLIAGGLIYALQSKPASEPVPDIGNLTPVEPGTKIRDGMVIQLSEPCSRFQKVLSDTPLVFEYGYWGFLPDYASENLENLTVEFYLDGELIGRQIDSFELIPTASLPCVDLAAYSADFVENGEWAYAVLEHPGLGRGEYLVEIAVSLNTSVATGIVDQGGTLMNFGPGEVLRIQKELLVE
ncbi:MAG TPA: hypothetical protein VJ965_02730 [Anaerolineales bacterium]|nr:hypothetical protein [Anaerolineales bacterium]